MSLGLIFWILMLITLIFGYIVNFRAGVLGPVGPWGNTLLWWILFLLLGWAVFGAPIKG